MRTIERMIEQEVICNVSTLVASLVGGDHDCSGAVNAGRPLIGLMDQAMDLCCPIQDWESAAMEAGWKRYGGLKTGQWWRDGEAGPAGEIDMIGAASAQDACDQDGIEPHEREIFEHWFVTEWLAEALEAKGERIDRDFAGHCVWGRTTTGQAIALDSVIEEVYADAAKRYADMTAEA